jgi:hypothetical protein
MATTKPIGSRDDPLVGPAGTGSTSTRRGPVLPRPRTPDDPAPVSPSAPGTAPADAAADPPPPLGSLPAAPQSSEAVAPFLELLEDVLAGGSVLGRQRQTLRNRGRRWLLPVGTSGEPLILFCGWLVALAIALAAYADVGPFSGPADAVLLLSAEGLLTVAVLGSLALAKAHRRSRVAKAAAAPVRQDDGSTARG